jgi:hypothetical protein
MAAQRVLNVAEKNSVALQVSGILSRGTQRKVGAARALGPDSIGGLAKRGHVALCFRRIRVSAALRDRRRRGHAASWLLPA